MSDIIGRNIHIAGIVQGVGFRPFVYNLATQLHLVGWVRNTSSGVDIRVDGAQETIAEFIHRLQSDIPPLAQIDLFLVEPCSPDGFSKFEITHSEPIPGAFQPISADICICEDCILELFDPTNRRYRYPFINCTNCGPRFTIIQDIPYDRPHTTMAGFRMCAACQAEYIDPRNRRFHAQPIACPECGPHVWLETRENSSISEQDEAILEAQQLLIEGKILAIKGIGGFHLACDATNPEAVNNLRIKKLRVDKPFAVMLASIQDVHDQTFCDQDEQELLLSRERPIVILNRRPGASISPRVAPGQTTMGILLPYTPLHYLLINQMNSTETLHSTKKSLKLVMTSGNLSEEPIAMTNEEARQRLSGLADAFLMHNRPIYTRCDDSVVRVLSNRAPVTIHSNLTSSPVFPVRRSRGYAPYPVHLPFMAPQLLATGAELKNTFCITRDDYAILSQHIGDMENFETYQSYEENISHFEKLFRVKPIAIAYDMHPDYLSTRYALDRSSSETIDAIAVQHHHAHIAACMVENGLSCSEYVLGIAFDGTGYGTDSAIWGGEFLIASLASYQRAAHLSYFPLPGGDTAIRKPARIALAYLWQTNVDWHPELPPVRYLCTEEKFSLVSQLQHKINTINTSSMGRLFDAVASLAGIQQQVNYEAQAAIELEAAVDPDVKDSYEFYFESGISKLPIRITAHPVIGSVVQDVLDNIPASIISAKFHNSVTNMVVDICNLLRAQYDINQVALSGGVWQNMTLLQKCYQRLTAAGFIVYIHRRVPTNDGGISLGQATVAASLYQYR